MAFNDSVKVIEPSFKALSEGISAEVTEHGEDVGFGDGGWFVAPEDPDRENVSGDEDLFRHIGAEVPCDPAVRCRLPFFRVLVSVVDPVSEFLERFTHECSSLYNSS